MIITRWQKTHGREGRTERPATALPMKSPKKRKAVAGGALMPQSGELDVKELNAIKIPGKPSCTCQ